MRTPIPSRFSHFTPLGLGMHQDEGNLFSVEFFKYLTCLHSKG